MRGRLERCRAWCLLAVAAWGASAIAGDRRDIVFDCPCGAEWVAGNPGESGTLTVTAGIRSHRAVESGDVRLSARWWRPVGDDSSMGRLSDRNRIEGDWSIKFAEPDPDRVILVYLLEETGKQGDAQWHRHETLALWPVPQGEDASGPLRYVDIFTDTDGDGVGDVNERLAGSAWQDAESAPGESAVDIIALYTAEFWEAEEGYPYTRILHHLNVVGAKFEDNDTNVRLRLVGMSEVEQSDYGWAVEEDRDELMESHGADMSIQFSRRGPGSCTGLGGCAQVGASRRSLWKDAQSFVNVYSTTVTAHELGHAMGLAHSARQGETSGAWRWSRGHHVTPRGQTPRRGTIMAYGHDVLGGVFSNPETDCGGSPCGVSRHELDGADSVANLDLLRYQIAAHRAPATDTDGDGFVNAADAAPEDPNDWHDIDDDGVGDNADTDDDNDGTDDVDDAFPLDPDEWEDADGDGIGDNADNEVADLSPFRDPALRAAVERYLSKPAGAAISAQDLMRLTQLHAQSSGIRDLTGLEQATRLERLYLAGNNIVDLAPLAGLTSLETLDLASNKIEDISALSGLSALSLVDLSNNPVSDISALAGLASCVSIFLNRTDVKYDQVRELPHFHTLESLGLAGLGITDLAGLEKAVRLRRLELDGNAIKDISALVGLTELRRLDLGENAVTDITPLTGLVRLNWLYIEGNAITDLSPLTDMTDLINLFADGNAIADISSLAGLVRLHSLRIKGNRIEDVAALADMTSLGLLDLGENRVSDIEPLSGLVNLDWLRLSGNRIVEVTHLADLHSLKLLLLSNNAIADIEPLAGLVLVDWLRLDGNRITDISALANMTTMVFLVLSGNAIADLGPLAGLDNVKWLYLDGNRIDDIADLANMTALRWLNLQRNDVTDLAPLSELVRLTSLGLDGNRIADVSPLSDMRNLRSLRLASNAVTDIGPLVRGSVFRAEPASKYVGLSGNPLDRTSREEHIPTLKSRGVHVVSRSPAVERLPPCSMIRRCGLWWPKPWLGRAGMWTTQRAGGKSVRSERCASTVAESGAYRDSKAPWD